MQVLVLAAQNAVPYELLGVATSGSTLFRQIGGSIGVSIFGAIFANQLALEPRVGAAAGRPAAASRESRARRAAAAARSTRPTSTPSPRRCSPCSPRRGSLARRVPARRWLLREVPLRKSVEAEGVAESFAMPREAEIAARAGADRHDARPAREPLARLRPARRASGRRPRCGRALAPLAARRGSGRRPERPAARGGARLARDRGLVENGHLRRRASSSMRASSRRAGKVSPSCSTAGSRRSTTTSWRCSTGSHASSSPRFPSKQLRLARSDRRWTRCSSRRALNRATLARQLLLERAARRRSRRSSTSSACRRRCRTTPTPGSGRGSPASGRSRCRELLERREVVRVGVMRGTIHLVTADDCLLLRPLVQPVFEAQLRRHPEHGPALRDVDLAPVVDVRAGAPRGEAAERDRAARDLRGAVPGPRPGRPRARLPDASRLRAGPPARALGPERTGEVDHGGVVARPAVRRAIRRSTSVVLRYLAAFGPASVADVTTWCRLTGMRAVVERLRPQLVTFRDERGRELFDLPDAPATRPRRRPRRCASCPSTTTSCSRTTTAAASSVEADRAALGARLDDRLGLRAARRGRQRRVAAGAGRVWSSATSTGCRRRRSLRSRRRAGGSRGSSRPKQPDVRLVAAQPLRPAPRRVERERAALRCERERVRDLHPLARARTSRPAAKQSPAP